MPRNQGCWANSLNDCKGKLTDEHLISVTAWQHEEPNAGRTAKGRRTIVHRVRDSDSETWREREVKVKDVRERILCDGHNNALADIDREAKRFSNALRAFFDAAHDHHDHPKTWVAKTKTFRLDGAKIERWLMKTTINLAIGDAKFRNVEAQFGGSELPTGKVSLDLASRVFGRVPVTEPWGIWLLVEDGPSVEVETSFNFRPWVASDGYMSGAIISMTGFHFAVSLENAPPPWPLVQKMMEGLRGWKRVGPVRPFHGMGSHELGVAILLNWGVPVAPFEIKYYSASDIDPR